ncbi:YciI family protein [Catellatospora citrea]|uniref:YciI family protein n=1 Tax=Catellatospora citrea TaxID=53366 RepID=UPI0033FAFAB6
MELESFELVMLRRPANPTEYGDAESRRIQAEHLAYLAGLRAAGRVVTNGPVLDTPDESLRGLVFFRTGSLEEARRLAEQDPAVRAGRLAVEVMTWWCPPGTMAAPGRTITLPD